MRVTVSDVSKVRRQSGWHIVCSVSAFSCCKHHGSVHVIVSSHCTSCHGSPPKSKATATRTELVAEDDSGVKAKVAQLQAYGKPNLPKVHEPLMQ
eukprot:758384-Amphidinium_carterae.2